MKTDLLVICQKVDDTDDLLGFFVAWLREFAGHFRSVHVIALGVGKYDVPDNVRIYSLGKERGVSKVRQALHLIRYLWRHTPRNGAVFCHMSPIFAIWAWPLARLRGARLVLWYLHRSVTARLRLALWLCDGLVTADKNSLRIQDPKILSVGHGIDVARFAVSDRRPPGDRPLHVLSVGRLSPIKDFGTLIRAASLARERQVSINVRIVGRSVMPADHAYARELTELTARLGLSDIVHFFGFVPYRDMPAHYRWADVVVGCTPPGGLDKVLLEGMAAGCVVLTSNDVMTSSLGERPERLLFNYKDANSLADRLAALDDWDVLSAQMVREVRTRHDLHQAVARISEMMSRSRAS